MKVSKFRFLALPYVRVCIIYLCYPVKMGFFRFSDTFWFSGRVIMVCCCRWPSFFTSHTLHLSCGAPSGLPSLRDLSHTGPKYLSSLAVHCACSDFCSVNSKTCWFKSSLKPRHTSPTICHLGSLGPLNQVGLCDPYKLLHLHMRIATFWLFSAEPILRRSRHKSAYSFNHAQANNNNNINK